MLKTLVLVTALCNISFMVFNTVIGPLARKVGMPEWQVGAMVSAAGFAWMLASRPWGRAGDSKGHWRMMRFGLYWFVAGFVGLCLVGIAGIEAWIPTSVLFALLFILRSFLGMTFAVVPVASQALVAGEVPIADRPAAMAALGIAGAIGMIFGPAIGGALGALSMWYPLMVAAGLALFSLIVILRSPLNKTHSGPEARVELANHAQTESIEPPSNQLAITDPRVRWPMLVAFSAMFCVMSAQVNTAFYLIDRLHISVEQSTAYTGLALTFVGVAIMCAQLLVRAMSSRGIKLTPNQMIMFGGFVGGCAFASGTLAQSMTFICVAYFFCGFGMGFVFPAISTLATTVVQTHEVGAASGTVSAAQASGMIAGPIVATMLFKVDPRLPYLVIGLILFFISLLALKAVTLSVDQESSDSR